MSKLFNRAGVATTTTGTGTVTLGAAIASGTSPFTCSYQTFATSGVADTNVVSYLILDANGAWEYGTGTYTASGTTLSRTLGQSSTGALLNLSGNAQVFVTARKEDLLSVSETQNANTVLAGPTSGGAATPTFRALVAADLLPANMTRRTITTTDTAGTGDRGNIIEVTSGTFTLAFTAAATLANGWWTVIFNHGTGDVTLDPNASETIDGLTTWVLYPGGAILVQCDGSAFHSVLLAPMTKQFDASSTFTKPGVGTFARIQAWGGGASGGRGRAAAVAVGGGGGGGGTFNERILLLSSLGTTETVTIGAGGAAQTVDSTAGNAGGNTTFGALITAFGGGAGGGSGGSGVNGGGGGGGGMLGAGAAGTGASVGGNGGSPIPTFGDNGTFGTGLGIGGANAFQGNNGGAFDAAFGAGNSNVYGGGGGGGVAALRGGMSALGGGGGGAGASGATAGGAGGLSIWGGGAGGGATVTGTAGTAGTSQFGGAGGAGGVGAGAPGAGVQPGGGGGGSQNNNSGAGGAGRSIIYIW